ncbi:hypothetical protein CICLE_v10002949mg [Citrus x clementina]|uniref:Uncharacterized protein n=1 Tax=Citrus clementina TaxID=85681 RepID=V4SXC8_CITCL|nr:uncharacterized protein LOC18042141 [Citrus x clementina]XP_015383336.1 uncharacterized protein LOC102616913 [Citrus sinensis]ESR45477.1 hypothetical protein CICLE_v10002949mg [Citrus x clementina]
MEGSSDVVRNIDRKSSIEAEPRTLGIDQIQYAREAALYVLRTRSVEEAMNVFMEGSERVENVSKESDRTIDCQEELQRLEDGLRPPPALRDVATAPF